MKLNKFLHQGRFPWFTALSILTPLPLWALVIAIIAEEWHAHPGIPDMSVNPLSAGTGAVIEMIALLSVGRTSLVLNTAWGVAARGRREYWGGRIAAASVALPLAVLFAWNSVSDLMGEANTRRLMREQVAADHARVWNRVDEVFVQSDGKLLLIGDGLVRLLPDGQPDPSFHRDYSYARGGSLPGPLRKGFYWAPLEGCAAMAPNGDLILAAKGWIGRVRPDGGDAPDLLKHPGEDSCWGLTVQPDGKILVGWWGKIPISRLLADGSVDPSFHPAFVLAPWTGREGPPRGGIALLRDGRILLAGLTVPVEGGCIPRLRRLKADGSPDESFRFGELCEPADLEEHYVPRLIAILPNGSMLVHMHNELHQKDETVYLDRDGKEIRALGPPYSVLRTRPEGAVPMSDGGILLDAGGWAARVRPDGTLDRGFHASYNYLSARKIAVQGEKIMVVDSGGKLSRLNRDGSPDPSFQMPELRVYSD